MAKGEGASALDQLRRLGKDPLAQRLLAGIAVINLLVSAIVGFSLYTNHKHYDKQAEIWTQNTARILVSNLVSETTRAMIQAHPVTATYKTTFARDHQERLVTFRRVAGYPFYIFATYSPRDYLVPWHLELAIAVALLAAFALATVVLARTILTSQTRELARMEAVRLGDAWQRQHEELQAALSRMKRLEGVIPICSYCKKIRTELKSWEQMEGYISEHSDAVFSHGVCPHCAQEQLRLFKEGNVQ